MRRRELLVGLSASLAGCAPVVQHALPKPSGFDGPSFSGDRFVSFDGARLGLKTWMAEGRYADDPWAVIIGLHGMDDYSNAFHTAGPWWAKQGIATYAYDQRGFGRSPERGVWAGEDLMVSDLRAACALARRMHPKAILAVAGESMGGAVAVAAFASGQPPDADRVILLSPAVWGFSQQPLPYDAMLWMASHTLPGYVAKPPSFLTRHIWASDNVRELIRMGQDPQMIFGSRFDTLYGLVALMETAWQGMARLEVPTLYTYGAHDQIIPPPAAISAADRLRPPGRTAYYQHGWHLLLRDLQAETVWADAEAFIRDPAGVMPSGAPPIPKSAPKGPKKPDLPPGVTPDGKIHLSELPRGEL
ncbi:MAG TPA: alpha/beta fold hydrolase [Caulobacteraceae bacterium]